MLLNNFDKYGTGMGFMFNVVDTYEGQSILKSFVRSEC